MFTPPISLHAHSYFKRHLFSLRKFLSKRTNCVYLSRLYFVNLKCPLEATSLCSFVSVLGFHWYHRAYDCWLVWSICCIIIRQSRRGLLSDARAIWMSALVRRTVYQSFSHLIYGRLRSYNEWCVNTYNAYAPGTCTSCPAQRSIKQSAHKFRLFFIHYLRLGLIANRELGTITR